MRFRRISLLIFALAAAALLPTGTAGSAEPGVDGALDRVTLQLKWQHQFQFAGYYAAVEQGYYRAAGLDVALIAAAPGQEPMQAVINGKADFGVGTTDLLLMRDAGIPVVVLAAIFQHSPLALMVRKGSGFDNIHELARGRLMIEPHSAELFAFLTNEGIPLDRLKLVEHDFDTRSVIDGSVDAMSVYSTDEPYDLASRNIPYVLFKPIESGIDFYGDNLFTMRGQIERNPDRVRNFVAASIKGWQYAMAHPRELAELIISRYGSRKNIDRLMFEAENMQPLINADIIEVGYINPGRWERIAGKYVDLGMIARVPDLGDFIYDPDPTPDLGFLYRLFGTLAVVAAVLALLVLWYLRLNRRLQHEIAERTEAQAELERLNRQKGLVLSIVGHDLRAAFNVLLNFGELLVATGDRMDKDRLTKAHKSMHDSAAAAYTLSSNLLDWAALQSGKKQPEAGTVALAPLIDQVTQLLAPQAAAKNVHIEVSVDDGLTVHVDTAMTETILRNLLGNAVKFTRPGGTVSVEARRTGDRAELTIADTGVGIAPERLARLFEIEPKSPAAGTAGEKGAGLGLVLCRELAAANGGTLRIESDPGAGTRVELGLPGQPAAALSP